MKNQKILNLIGEFFEESNAVFDAHSESMINIHLNNMRDIQNEVFNSDEFTHDEKDLFCRRTFSTSREQ